MDFAQGKIVLALEGGYNLGSISNSVFACMNVLLEDKPVAGSSEAYPFESTWRVIQAVKYDVLPSSLFYSFGNNDFTLGHPTLSGIACYVVSVKGFVICLPGS